MAKYSVAFMIMNIFLIILGLGSAGVGIWMNAERDVKAYLYVLGANPSGNWLIAGTGLFITAGFILIGVAILGLKGPKNRTILTAYCALIIIIMILEMTAGFLAVAFRDKLYDIAARNMQNQVQNHYTWDNKLGKMWNRVQVRQRCCGADSAEDYRCSEWWYSQDDNGGFGCPDNYYNAPIHVPDSCCVLEFNQDRDPEQVDPQNARPKNRERCNEDTAGNMWSGSSNVNGRGCYSALQDHLFDHIYILMGIGLGTGVLQFVSVVFGFLQRSSIYKEDI